MKRMIYTPAKFEEIPLPNKPYYLPVAGVPVVDVIVPEDFVTGGTVHYDSLNGPMLAEPFIHYYDGWDVTEAERLAALGGV